MIKVKELIGFLRRKYPEWELEKMIVNKEGHQNLVVIIGDSFVFRFPRSREQYSFQLEQLLMPHLKNALSIPVPDFILTSKPGEEFIYSAYPMIKGIYLYDYMFYALKDEEKKKLAHNLGTFLTELHSFSVDPWKEYFPDSHETAITRWKSKWDYVYQQVKVHLFPQLDEKNQMSIMQYFEGYLNNPANFSFTPRLIHGDLKYKHLLYDWKDKKLAGIIDFGNMELGDPAYDFEELLVVYGEQLVRRVLRQYKLQVEANFLDRIRFYSTAMRFADYLEIKRNQESQINDQLTRLKLKIGEL